MHADRDNRVALIVFGLLVLAAGAAGMAASTGYSGPRSRGGSCSPTASAVTSATTAGCGTLPPGSAW